MSNLYRNPIAIRNEKKYYPSNVMNQIIVNAVTGVKYPYRVGSKDSLRLYKVTDTTGAFTLNGKKKNTQQLEEGQEKEPNHYYFDNPAEYMQSRHFHRDTDSCELWSEYQKGLRNLDDHIDLTVYHSRKSKNLCYDMRFMNKIESVR